MSSVVIVNIVRFFVVVLFQVFVFNEFYFSLWGQKLGIVFVYPLFIMLLPVTSPKVMVISLAFVMGVVLDWFCLTPGVHSFALVFTAFVRSYVLEALSPRGGYKVNDIPSNYYLGFPWFVRYCFFMLAIHIVLFFGVEVFRIQGMGVILLRWFFSFLSTAIVTLLVMVIYRPRI